jgi:hypothetical protein
MYAMISYVMRYISWNLFILFLLCFASLRCHFATLNDWSAFTTFIPTKYITYGIIDYLDIGLFLIVLSKLVNLQFEYALNDMCYVI